MKKVVETGLSMSIMPHDLHARKAPVRDPLYNDMPWPPVAQRVGRARF